MHTSKGLFSRRPAILILFLIGGLGGVPAKAQTAPPANWKGKIELRDGVETILNPATPLYGRLKLDLREELRIGRESDKDYQFWFVNGVQVDDKGRFYVSDTKDFRIQVFDRDGRFVRSIGRQGQGPGEFQQISLLRIEIPSGRLYARDIPAWRISVFDLQGTFLDAIPTKSLIYDFLPFADGGLVAVTGVESASDLKVRLRLVRMDPKGRVVSRKGDFLASDVFEREPGGSVGGVATGYELRIYLAELPADRFAYAFSGQYELTITDKDLKPLRRIIKDEPLPAYTPDERRGFGKITLPTPKPYFLRMLSDSTGRIYVQKNFTKNKSTVQDDIPMEVDVFSPEGYFIYTTALPPNTDVIRDGYLYAYSVDWEKGLETVFRHKIVNWGQMK